MTKPYEILEHTADLKIKVYGKDLPELFFNCLKGMTEAMSNVKYQISNIKRKIEIKSPDLESLLVDFLSEALYLSDINNEVYFEVEFDKFSEKELSGIIKGMKVEGFKEEIKAVTYHELEIKKANEKWEAVVLFDI